MTAYGPQANHLLERKLIFWSRISQEVEDAQELDTALVIQMDGNLWAGEDLIKGDPNKCYNGKQFIDFLKKPSTSYCS